MLISETGGFDFGDFSVRNQWVLRSPSCGRLCLYNEKINFSTSLAGQAVGVKEVDHGIWWVSFMDRDLGYVDLEEKALQPLENPFGPKV